MIVATPLGGGSTLLFLQLSEGGAELFFVVYRTTLYYNLIHYTLIAPHSTSRHPTAPPHPQSSVTGRALG